MGLIRISRLWTHKDIPYAVSRAAETASGDNIRDAIDDWNFQTKINIIGAGVPD